MRTLFLLCALALPLAALNACDQADNKETTQASAAQAAPYRIDGSLVYLARIALVPGSIAVFEIRNVADDTAVFEHRIELDGKQIPIPFTLDVPRDRLTAGASYALHAAILSGDNPLWQSSAVALDTGADQAALGEILLRQPTEEKAEESADESVTGDPAPEGRLVAYQCGDKTLTLTLSAGETRMDADGATYTLENIVSASGAKYQAIGQPDTVFWSKGNTASVTVQGQDWPECVATATETAVENTAENTAQNAGAGANTLYDTVWVLEDLNKGGVIDNSRTTLLFDGSGRASGRGGCNQYNAGYTQDGAGDHNSLTFSPNAAMTMMACAPALMEQERRYIDTLSDVTAYRFDETGALVLTTADGQSLLFRGEEPAPTPVPTPTPTPAPAETP